jgi:hypothetical protein
LVTTSSVRIDVISTYHRMNNGAEEISFCGEVEAVSQPPATSLGVNVSYEDPEPLADCRFYKANGDCPLNTIDYDTVDSLAECATWCRELPECSHFVFWKNEVLMLSEETQLVGVFAMFCGASYVLGNQAVADMLDAKGKAIIAQHNALEDEAIASIKEVVDAHAGRVALLGELKAISGAQAEALGLLKAAKTMELQHAVRDSIVKKLDTLVAKDELVTAGIQAKLVADAAAAVTGQFASPEVKTKALTEAIDALSSPDAKPALVTDLFAAHFKAAATSAAAKQGKEVELPAAALAELNDELAALAKRDGFTGAVPKMPAKVAA